MIKGIDISAWQDQIPAFDGEFIIIRAGWGQVEDGKFKTHYNNAKKLKKRIGVYWYSYAIDLEGARNEARKCLEVIKGLDISMGVWFDMEDADRFKERNAFTFTKKNISTMCNAFCEIVENAGYYTGIYASASWLKQYINCPKYDKWCAHWFTNNGKIPAGKEAEIRSLGASMWQYTSKLDGRNQDGNVLLHNDIDMYNVQPKKPAASPTPADQVKEIIKLLEEAIERLKKM